MNQYEARLSNILAFHQDLLDQFSTMGPFDFRGVLFTWLDLCPELPLSEKIFKVYDLVFEDPTVKFKKTRNGEEIEGLVSSLKEYVVIEGFPPEEVTYGYKLISFKKLTIEQNQPTGQIFKK